MESRLKGALYIGFGIFIVLMSLDIIVKVLLFALGLYLIHRGLELRNANNVLFYIHRFKNRF